MATTTYWVTMNFMTTGSVHTTLHLQAQIYIFIPSPHLLPNLGKIWYTISAHNSVDHL